MDALQDPQYRTTDGSALRIWKDTAQNNFLTEREGRPIFDEVIMVEVISPGSRDSTPIFEVERKFAPEMGLDQPLRGMQYAQFKDYIVQFLKDDEVDASLSGTPLSQWSEMTKTMAASLKAQNIFTVDALAQLPDSRLTVVGPDGRTWREKAKAFIENAKGNAYATELAAQLDRTKADLADSQRLQKELADKVAALENAAAGGATSAKASKAVATPAEPATGEVLNTGNPPPPII
jgi:hypothetical protein